MSLAQVNQAELGTEHGKVVTALGNDCGYQAPALVHSGATSVTSTQLLRPVLFLYRQLASLIPHLMTFS